MDVKDKINTYYYDLKNKDEFKYFLFKKFYISPKKVLTKNKDDINNNDFYDENILKNYRNSEFIDLLNIILYDDEFLNKIDYYNLISIDKFIKSCDLKLNGLERLININERIKYNREIKIYDLKEKVFNEIREDNSSFLYLNYYNSDKIIDSLLCDNRFLDVLENEIIDRENDEYTINNIIEMLLLSIRLKSDNPETVNEVFTRNKLMKREYYKDFDIKRAEYLINKLENKLKEIKRKRKIIYLS